MLSSSAGFGPQNSTEPHEFGSLPRVLSSQLRSPGTRAQRGPSPKNRRRRAAPRPAALCENYKSKTIPRSSGAEPEATARAPPCRGCGALRDPTCSQPELLDRGVPRVQAGRDDADGGEHRDAAVVQLARAHLLGVVVPPRQRVPEVAGLLLRVLHEHGRLQAPDDREDRQEPHLPVAHGARGHALRDALHAWHLRHALHQHAQGAHHRQAAVLELLGPEVLELLLALAKPERVPEAQRRLAMMGALGMLVQSVAQVPGMEGVPKGVTACTVGNGQVGFLAILAIIGGLEAAVFVQDPKKEPGNFGNPLPWWDDYSVEMRARELNNGRIAMFSAIGIIAASLYTGNSAIEQFGL